MHGAAAAEAGEGQEWTLAVNPALSFLSANQALGTPHVGDEDMDGAAIISRSQQFLGRRLGSPTEPAGRADLAPSASSRGEGSEAAWGLTPCAHGATSVQPHSPPAEPGTSATGQNKHDSANVQDEKVAPAWSKIEQTHINEP